MRLVAGLLFVCLSIHPIEAQLKPWCTEDLLKSSAQPYPAPAWKDLRGVPDYEKLSSNFVLTQNLRLLISTMEKTIAELQSGKSRAGAGEINGVCLCDCNQDAAFWANFLGGTVRTEAKSALDEALDQYIQRMETKVNAAQQTVTGAVPAFKGDVEKIVTDTCNAMNTCSTTTGVKERIYKDAGEVAQKKVEELFLATLKQNGLEELKKEAETLKADALALLAKLGGDVWKGEFASPENLEQYESLKQRIKTLLDHAVALVKDTVVKLATDFGPNLDAVASAVITDLDAKMDADTKTWQTLEPTIKAAVDARVKTIKNALQDVYDTAIDRDKVLDDFGARLQSGLLQNLSKVEGCYGVMKKANCSAAAFCKGRPVGKKLFGNDDLELPLWTPTDVYKDPGTALRWALSAVGWLEKVKKVMSGETTADFMKLLKNGEQILAQLDKYVDLYTDGYHQGAYSNLRADLTTCTAYAGSGLMAELFSTNGGDFRGGANYLSASLVKDHVVQFRSSGLALYVNGRHLPLAPGVSLNAAIDGWKLFDHDYPFGIGRDDPSKGWSFHPGDLGVFNLVKREDLEKICCKTAGQADCIQCPITGSSFLHKGFYPVEYTSGGALRRWPRDKVEWEKDERIAAVAGAGLNLELQMKTRHWSAAPIPLFGLATITPWMSLDAGMGWRYKANHFRDLLREQVNKGLPQAAKLTAGDFARDTEPFQAPDASLDAGNRAEVKPKLGADVVLGFDLSRFARVGVTANLYVGVDVSVEGAGGVVDLDRGLVDSVKQSTPEPKHCKPVITEKSTRVCSNEAFKRKVFENDQAPVNEPGKLYSNGTYKCDDGSCEKKGYCKEGKKIVAHDVTREECETANALTGAGICVAPYRVNASVQGAAELVPYDQAAFGPPSGVYSSGGYGTQQIALAQAQAEKRSTKAECEAAGWCINYKFVMSDSTPEHDYRGSFIDVARTREACPPARYRDGSEIKRRDGGPMLAQFVPFEWRPAPPPSTATVRRFFPYQCADAPRPEVTSWTGTDCSPIQFGYPSACPGQECSCIPGGKPCPPGQTCVDGACVPVCTSNAACGENRKCAGGGCVLANDVPYAEQVAYRMRNAAAPTHTVATYGLDKLIASVVAGVGVNVGLRYKLFRKEKFKTLLDDKWSFTIASFPGVKHQLGIESQYQSDCNAAGKVTNHQPALVKRHAGNVTPATLVQWCKPAMAADAQNPVEMPSVEETIGASVDATLKFGADIGIDYWTRSQMCISGKPVDQYFASLENDPAALWAKLRCSVTRNGVKVPLACSSGAELQTSLLVSGGCLDTTRPHNAALLAIVGQQWLFPGTTSLDPRKLFIDDDGALNRWNVEPAVLSLATDKQFSIDAWLTTLEVCAGDPEVDIVLDLKKEDLQPCGGSCCEGGVCRDVKSSTDCRGSFRPATTCAASGACPASPTGGAGGACFVFGRCQQVASAADCQGSFFYEGKTCADVPAEEPSCIPLVLNETASWSFDEEKLARDRALTDNAAAHAGTTTLQTGVHGKALCLDGRSGHALVADHAEVDFEGACPNAEPFTISFWIRTTSASGVVAVLDKRQAGPRGYHVFLYNGRPGVQLATGPAFSNEVAPVSIADGKWHFIAVRVAPRCSPDARGTIFVDGRTVWTFRPREGELGNTAALNVGRRDPAFGATYLAGCLDELTIIKHGVSDYDLRALYYSGARGRCRPRPCALDAGLTNAHFLSGSRSPLAQTFTPTKTGYLTQVTHGAQAGGGTTAYDLLITTTNPAGLPSWSGGPYNVPGVLYSAPDVKVFSTGGVSAAVQIPGDRRLLLSEGVRYALVLVHKGQPTATMTWRGNSGGSVYPRGAAYELVGPSWVPSTGPADYAFFVDGSCQ